MNKFSITITAFILLATTLVIGTIFLFIQNKNLKSDLAAEKILNEFTESNKNELLKKHVNDKSEIDSLIQETINLTDKLSKTILQLDDKNKEVVYYRNYTKLELNNKSKEIENIKTEYNAEIQRLKEQNSRLLIKDEENQRYIKEMAGQKNTLSENLTTLKQLAANNYRTEAVRGENDRLVVKSCRAQRLITYFDIPKTRGSEKINFSVVSPSNKEFSSENPEIAFIKISDLTNNEMQRVALIFKPKEKLEKGIYNFQIKNNEQFIGSSQIRLR